ncbi:MAG TPA: DUF4139 domain-containing protein [Steroidobacteraceae bacterium]|nr:DUF4139 domain-containing protein [Steroidobacteraceae bacterium]
MSIRSLAGGGMPAAMCGFLCLSSCVAAAAEGETGITIYSSAEPGAVPAEYYRPLPGRGVNADGVPGYAMVSQDRKVSLSAGRTQLRFTDVAALIDPTTVQFVSLSDPENTKVLEQNFQFDLVSTQKLLSRYVDKTVTVQVVQGAQSTEVAGTLLSAGDGLVLRGADGQIRAINQYSNLRFAELPGGLITRPTLLWDISSRKAGEQTARVSYQTAGMTWWADYNLTFTPGADANSGFVDVGAWVSIVNQSGAGYEDAKLKLIAGDVQRAQPRQRLEGVALSAVRRSTAAEDAGFAEKSFFEYHLYTLGRRTSLPENSTKQLELFDAARHVPARKTLVYYGQAGMYYGPGVNTDRSYGANGGKKVDVYLEFRNDEKSGLGVPLPKGRVRVSQIDTADHGLEFVGEDVIDHTPKNERVLVKLGSAFDVVGERRQVDFAVDSKAKWMEEEIEIKLRNHKTAPVEVLVRENLFRWTNWTVQSSSAAYEKGDARTVYFTVKVPADGEQTFHYRVRYTW